MKKQFIRYRLINICILEEPLSHFNCDLFKDFQINFYICVKKKQVNSNHGKQKILIHDHASPDARERALLLHLAVGQPGDLKPGADRSQPGVAENAQRSEQDFHRVLPGSG